MGSLILKLVYILTALSIAADLLHFGGFRFNAKQYGTEISAQSSALFFPGAHGLAFRLAKSAIKAAKRKAKNQAKKAGKAKNKAKKTKGGAEHTRNARKSTKGKHQKGQARKNKDQQRSNKNRG